jgi:hypothetical protein
VFGNPHFYLAEQQANTNQKHQNTCLYQKNSLCNYHCIFSSILYLQASPILTLLSASLYKGIFSPHLHSHSLFVFKPALIPFQNVVIFEMTYPKTYFSFLSFCASVNSP